MSIIGDYFNHIGNFIDTSARWIGDRWNDITGVTANNAFNAEQAQKQRDFEERMSSTAYQRSMEDMESAGLNASAMYGSGGAGGPASTPSGRSASASSGHGSLLSLIAPIMSSAAMLKNANTNLLKEIDMNSHMTNREKNYLEHVIGQNEYYSAKAMSLKNNQNYSHRRYTKKDFDNVFDNLDDVDF